MKPTVAVLYVPGTNCHEETVFAIEQAGAQAKIVILQAILDGQDQLTRYDALIIPGGFSWGDHLGAGRIEGVFLISRCRDQLEKLVSQAKPILGICNGFQVLVETGLLPNGQIGDRSIALLQNLSARFESRWVNLLVSDTQCIWTEGLAGRELRMPVAHVEGRVSCLSSVQLRPTVYYVENGQPTEAYPANPNGSSGGVAGICDKSGLIFGLMPHPERATEEWHGSDGLLLFKNLVNYFEGSY